MPFKMDLSDRNSIKDMISTAQQYGEIEMLVNGAGVSPSQASIEQILKIDLYGTAVLLEDVGKVIMKGGVGVTISSQSGKRMPQLTAEEDRLLACTPTEELLSLGILKPQNIQNTLHAYQLLQLTSLMGFVVIFTKICLQNALSADLEQLMKLQTLLNS